MDGLGPIAFVDLFLPEGEKNTLTDKTVQEKKKDNKSSIKTKMETQRSKNADHATNKMPLDVFCKLLTDEVSRLRKENELLNRRLAETERNIKEKEDKIKTMRNDMEFQRKRMDDVKRQVSVDVIETDIYKRLQKKYAKATRELNTARISVSELSSKLVSK